ncbi:MAG TPA: thioredoxin domain-containing protein [Frankiaceae bacterium]|jgi:thioredoxin 2|nr:thioredoxin domain-containing protein [Frankiaceae bacterium]
MSTTTEATTILCTNCGTRNRVPIAAAGKPRCGKCQSPLPWVVAIKEDAFAAAVEGADLPVLLDVWAEWCRPCRILTPALEKLAAEMAGTLKLVKLNADESPNTMNRFQIKAIPTLLVMVHGEERAHQAGAVPLPQLRSWLASVLDEASTT